MCFPPLSFACLFLRNKCDITFLSFCLFRFCKGQDSNNLKWSHVIAWCLLSSSVVAPSLFIVCLVYRSWIVVKINRLLVVFTLWFTSTKVPQLGLHVILCIIIFFIVIKDVDSICGWQLLLILYDWSTAFKTQQYILQCLFPSSFTYLGCWKTCLRTQYTKSSRLTLNN